MEKSIFKPPFKAKESGGEITITDVDGNTVRKFQRKTFAELHFKVASVMVVANTEAGEVEIYVPMGKTYEKLTAVKHEPVVEWQTIDAAHYTTGTDTPPLQILTA